MSGHEMQEGSPRNNGQPLGESYLEVPVVLTARRGQVRRTRTLAPPDAEVEAQRLRLEGWSVTLEMTPKSRARKRVQKQRAQVIATHRRARQARQEADDAADAKQAAVGADRDGKAT
jgi:hypothetical protein